MKKCLKLCYWQKMGARAKQKRVFTSLTKKVQQTQSKATTVCNRTKVSQNSKAQKRRSKCKPKTLPNYYKCIIKT